MERENLLVFLLEYYHEDNNEKFLGNLAKFKRIFFEGYLENNFKCSVYTSEEYDLVNKTLWKNICNFEYQILDPDPDFEGSVLWSDKVGVKLCKRKETTIENILSITMENINLYDGYITTKDGIFCGNWLYFVFEYK